MFVKTRTMETDIPPGAGVVITLTPVHIVTALPLSHSTPPTHSAVLLLHPDPSLLSTYGSFAARRA